MTWLDDLAAMVSMISIYELAALATIFTPIGGLIGYLYSQWKVRQSDAKLEEIIQRRVDKLEEIFATKNEPHDNFLETKELAATLGCTDEEVDEAARRIKTIEPSSGHLTGKRGYQKKVSVSH